MHANVLKLPIIVLKTLRLSAALSDHLYCLKRRNVSHSKWTGTKTKRKKTKSPKYVSTWVWHFELQNVFQFFNIHVARNFHFCLKAMAFSVHCVLRLINLFFSHHQQIENISDRITLPFSQLTNETISPRRPAEKSAWMANEHIRLRGNRLY